MVVFGIDAGHSTNLAKELVEQGSKDKDIKERDAEAEQKGDKEPRRIVAGRAYQGHFLLRIEHPF